jgi:beta-glucanase (GH16 family)
MIAPLLLFAAATTEVPLAPPPGYQIVWRDEFSGVGLPDERRWRYDTAFNKSGWHNEEKQYYAARRKRNARLWGGRLIVEAHADGQALRRRADYGGQTYSSARLITRGKASWTYGFFEVRAKLPCGRGTWPAIWMLSAREPTRSPEDGEIDIMEHVGHEPGVVHQSVHTGAFNQRPRTHKTAQRVVADACGAFHLYQLHWTGQRIRMGIDGAELFRFDKPSGNATAWPFNTPQYLLLNVAVGGQWGGAKGIDDAALPQRMEVDYVRVWQAKS